MPSLSQIDFIEARIERYSNWLATANSELAVAKGNQFFKCPTCSLRTKVNGTTLIRKHWHVAPGGGGSGDHWRFGEYLVVCSKCNTGNRVYQTSTESDNGMFTFVNERESQFNEVLEWYPSRNQSQINLDELREIKHNKSRGY